MSRPRLEALSEASQAHERSHSQSLVFIFFCLLIPRPLLKRELENCKDTHRQKIISQALKADMSSQTSENISFNRFIKSNILANALFKHLLSSLKVLHLGHGNYQLDPIGLIINTAPELQFTEC